MKKSFIALASFLAAGTVFAQSSVALFGVVDLAVQNASQGNARVSRLNGVGGNQFSRIGVRGTEDLGGGLSASFVLDAGLNVDSGAGALTTTDNLTTTGSGGLSFSRRSTVSLSSINWGEVRVGRDFVPTYWNLTVFDPFGSAGAGSVNNLAQGALTRSSTVQTAIRASNTIGYFLPSGKGIYGQAMYAVGEKPSSDGVTKDDGRYYGIRVGYAAGAMNVAASFGRTTLASGDVSTANAGASYTMGIAKIQGQYFRDNKNVVSAPSSSNGLMLGVRVSTGAGYVPLSYTKVKDNSATDRNASQLALGYVHDLSKRTAVYTTYSRIQNKNGAALTGGGVAGVANSAWTGLDVGIRHTF
ncbi:MAG: porin [Rhodoferax sp.]|nr:porin [Rhodoferax sp.]